MEYNIKEITPERMRCVIGGCPAIYDLTPKNMRCCMGACPSIYEVTPEKQRCGVGCCPSIHQEDEQGNYLIVGKVVNPSEFELEGKVGEGEVLIKVPKALIDEKEK